MRTPWVTKDFLPSFSRLNEAEAAFVVPGFDEAFEADGLACEV